MNALETIGNTLLSQSLAYPDAVQEAPWGHQVAKVRKKVFVFFSIEPDRLGFTVKLPASAAEALETGWMKPTGYGLGKSGWCSGEFKEAGDVPLDRLLDWMDESYRAVAPKSLTKDLPEGLPPIPPPEVIPKVPAGALRILLIGDDLLRLERGQRQFAKRGIEGLLAPMSPETLDMAGQGSPSAMMVDLSKNAAVGQALAAELAVVCWDVPMLVAGIRDKKMEVTLAAALPRAKFSRDAPGDDTVLDLLLAMAAGA